MKKTSEKLTDIIPPPVVTCVLKDNTIAIVGIDKVMKEGAETLLSPERGETQTKEQ